MIDVLALITPLRLVGVMLLCVSASVIAVLRGRNELAKKLAVAAGIVFLMLTRGWDLFLGSFSSSGDRSSRQNIQVRGRRSDR